MQQQGLKVGLQRFAFLLTRGNRSDSLFELFEVEFSFQILSKGNNMRVVRKTLAVVCSFLILGTVVVFFGFHTLAGERGVLAKPELERKIVVATEELRVLKRKKAFIMHRVELMHNSSVDADILEEMARSELGLYSPNDVIVSIDLPELKF